MKYNDPTPELVFSKFLDFKTKTQIILKNDICYVGIIQSFSPGTGKIGNIKIWHFLESRNRDKYEQTKSKNLIIDIDHSNIKSIESLNID